MFKREGGITENVLSCIGLFICNFEQGRTLKPHHDNTSRAGVRYTIGIASLELRHKEHNNDPQPLQNNTKISPNSAHIDLVYRASSKSSRCFF